MCNINIRFRSDANIIRYGVLHVRTAARRMWTHPSIQSYFRCREKNIRIYNIIAAAYPTQASRLPIRNE